MEPFKWFLFPKVAFNSCPLNFRSHWMGLLFISIVERGVGCLSASFLWSTRGLLQKNTFLSYSAESKESDGLKGWGQHCEWSIVLVLSQLFSVNWVRQTQGQAATGVSTRRKGRMKLWGSPNGEQIILLNLLRKVLRLLSWSLKAQVQSTGTS